MLPVVIFFSTAISMLYYLGVMQIVIQKVYVCNYTECTLSRRQCLWLTYFVVWLHLNIDPSEQTRGLSKTKTCDTILWAVVSPLTKGGQLLIRYILFIQWDYLSSWFIQGSCHSLVYLTALLQSISFVFRLHGWCRCVWELQQVNHWMLQETFLLVKWVTTKTLKIYQR